MLSCKQFEPASTAWDDIWDYNDVKAIAKESVIRASHTSSFEALQAFLDRHRTCEVIFYTTRSLARTRVLR